MEECHLEIDLAKFPLSKSILIRQLLLKSYRPEIEIDSSVLAEDVQYMRKAVDDFLAGLSEFYLGASATAFRFFCLRLSRLSGSFSIRVHDSLRKRPHAELFSLLEQLNVKDIEWSGNTLRFQAHQWPHRDLTVNIDTTYSSQYLSAFFLNLWGFPYKVLLETNQKIASQAYWELSKEILNQNNLQVNSLFEVLELPALPLLQQAPPEPDMSSLAAILAFSCLKGRAVVKPFSGKMLQPDFVFFEFIQSMGVKVSFSADEIVLESSGKLAPLDVDLTSCPDLFPVLSVLASRAAGTSIFRGVSHLRAKESNRLQKIAELLSLVGVKFREERDLFQVYGKSGLCFDSEVKKYDSANDHRLVMAVALLRWMGAPLRILNVDSINKSFPEYFSYAPLKSQDLE